MTAPLPSPSPTPPPTLATSPSLNPVNVTGATTVTAPDGFLIEVQPPKSSDAGIWVTAIVGLFTFGAAITAAILARRTGKDAAREAGESARAAHKSADAAQTSAGAATKAANATESATIQVDEWRKREETMRLLRAGAELAARAAEADSTPSLVGQAMLLTLRDADNIVQPVDKQFIERVIDAINQATQRTVGDDDQPVIVEP